MIFYTARNDENRLQIVGTQADARAINKAFEQIDIPTDKAAIMAWAQDMFARIDTAEAEAQAARDQLAQLHAGAIDAPPLMHGNYAPAQMPGAVGQGAATEHNAGYEPTPFGASPVAAPVPAISATAGHPAGAPFTPGPVPLAEEFEIAWEAFPLPLKLHYAELAIHDARVKIRPGR